MTKEAQPTGSQSAGGRAGPPGVIPHLVCAGASEAIAFYEKAFGAEPTCRLAAPNGAILHAALAFGDQVVMLADEFPEMESVGPKSLKGTPVTIHLYVENVDAAFKRATDAGARVVMPLEDMFWGDRYGVLEDPFGHRWSMATHLRDVSPEEMQEAAARLFSEGCPQKAVD